jgi:DNA-binding transcriptional regulator YdaS (Cro superfamily)
MIAFFVPICEHYVMKNIIEEYRLERGMTFGEMALAAGFRSRSSVFQHCSGARTISAESAMKYFRAFGIPLSEIRPDLWPPAYGKAIAAKQKAVEQASPAMSANGDQEGKPE